MKNVKRIGYDEATQSEYFVYTGPPLESMKKSAKLPIGRAPNPSLAKKIRQERREAEHLKRFGF